MAVITGILKVLGIVILVVLAVLLLAVLLILLVPVRYSLNGEIRDPDGSEQIFHLKLKRDINFHGDVTWFWGAVHLTAGIESPDGKQVLELRLFGKKLPLDKILNRKKKPEEPKQEAPEEAKEEKTIEEKIEAVLKRIEKLYRRVDDALYVLATEDDHCGKQTIGKRRLYMLDKVVPDRWGLTGVIGLGDPARSANVFSLQGILYPVTAGHVALGTEYELYRYDLQFFADGGIRLISFLTAGLKMVLSKDVRRLIMRLLRGPGGRKRKRSSGAQAKNAA